MWIFVDEVFVAASVERCRSSAPGEDRNLPMKGQVVAELGHQRCANITSAAGDIFFIEKLSTIDTSLDI
jgi:hypothetical protein